ncbi:DUF2795 domain-containing protein [Actinomycetospora sp. NBRC 106375]|uniref:DUF2795 domain-containing protein n=1 Tax=Actinomycetospora sp. NBRC 106375 TaxID=3032207 RepID=UPI002552E033|nr:DUF2795 domain-containing protein [Actinomycetospora sp. NBRC 106375]
MWAAVFDGLEWPLERWQLLVAADEYGISPRICDRLARVPHRRYEDLTEVEDALGIDEPSVEQA